MAFFPGKIQQQRALVPEALFKFVPEALYKFVPEALLKFFVVKKNYLRLTFFNDTEAEITICTSSGFSVFSETIPKGERLSVRVDPFATDRKYRLQTNESAFDHWVPLDFSSYNLLNWSEVRISFQEREIVGGTSEAALCLTGAVSHFMIRKDYVYNATTGTVSLRIHLAWNSSIELTKLLETVRICRYQCDHLVQTYKKGIERIQHLHSELADDPSLMLEYHHEGRLEHLLSFLDALESIVCDAKDLLRACKKEVDRIALLVSSMPMPPDDEKEMEICSNFDLVIGELNWSFDLIEYVLQPAGAVALEWCPTLRRYALKREGSTVKEVKYAVMTPSDTNHGDVQSPARKDRGELLSGLEYGSISIRTDPTNSWYAHALHQLKKQFTCQKTATKGKDEHQPSILHHIIVKRCKVEMRFGIEQKPNSPNLRSLSVDIDCFKINPSDLKPDAGKVLGPGAYKTTYEGEWCGQNVAIATTREFDIEELKDEVKQLIGLQHPKVVSFYGWAYTEDAPPPIKTLQEVKNDHKCQGFYIVTEKMECDLHELISNITLSTTVKKRDSGGPFSHSVGLDILLQIVEAMVHVHKHGVMHRDLKPKNFLVRSRSSPKSGVDKFYDVKLIDFGSSKIFVVDKNTYDRGTTRYSAPEMMKGQGGEGVHGKYNQSVDVFSFAMTCYQVCTGVEPFRNTLPRNEILGRRRPDIPATILSGLKEVMEASWAEDPKTRPTFEQIREKLWTIKKSLAVPIGWYT